MKVYDRYKKRMGKDMLMLSITIDPDVDNHQRLKAYADSYGEHPGWLYLTGDYDEIDALRHKLGVYDPDPVIDADKTQHAGLITFGSDYNDRWAALPGLMDVDGIVETVNRVTSRPLPTLKPRPWMKAATEDPNDSPTKPT